MTRPSKSAFERNKPVLRVVLPAAVAALAIFGEPYLSAFARSRPGVLPIAMFVLMGIVIAPRLRRWLIVTLCFGVALLALRPVALPPSIHYMWLENAYPYIGAAIAILASFAGMFEALRPGSVAARRCYFSAAALYLLSYGSILYAWKPSVSAAVLVLSGALAFVGAFAAPRIVERETAAPSVDEDLAALAQLADKRAQALAAREWKDKSDRISSVI